MPGTGLDEQTKQDVESGVPSAKSPKSAVGRSNMRMLVLAQTACGNMVFEETCPSAHTALENEAVQVYQVLALLLATVS